MDDRRARERMVATQIVRRGIRDERVLAALLEVPRHAFVPPHLQHDAYDDRPLPIGEGQTISQPYIVASMTASLAPEAGHRVLEIGTGSGYQAAILARLAADVITIERHASLAARASEVFRELGFTNIRVIVGDGTEGYEPAAPYDRILVTAGAPAVPESLTRQLGDGSRLVLPVGPAGFQHVRIVDRQGDLYLEQEGEGCVFVPLIGRYGWSDSGASR
jgi:protein-L-isoaspartate(D-aspartate) O-methyltransferase